MILFYAKGGPPADATPEDGYYGTGDGGFGGIHERMARNRTVDIFRASFDGLYRAIAGSHGQRSRWYKPQVSLAITLEVADIIIPESLVIDAANYNAATDANIGIQMKLLPTEKTPTSGCLTNLNL